MFSIRKYLQPNIFGRQEEVLLSKLRETKKFLIIFVTGVGAAVFSYACTPIVVYLATNEVIPLLPTEIIFCDQTQTSGFIVASIGHLTMGIFAAIGTIFYGTIFIFCLSNYVLQGNLVTEDFQVLDGMWNGMNVLPLAHKRAFLKNIWKKRQDMNKY